MFTPANHTFRIFQGATWSETITLKNADGSIFDLTGLSARMQLREDLNSATPALELNTTNTRLSIPVGTDGEIQLLVSAADTETLAPSYDTAVYVYDLELYRASPSPEYVVRALQGSVIVNPEITRA